LIILLLEIPLRKFKAINPYILINSKKTIQEITKNHAANY